VATLTPLQLIAGAGLANNTALAVSSELVLAIDAYRSTTLLTPFAATLANGQVTSTLGPGGSYSELLILTADTCPPLSDSTPAASASTLGILLANSASAGNTNRGFTSLIPAFGNIYLGSGDNSIFVQVFTSADGYVNSTNSYILTVNNSNTYLGSSFTTMNSLITGDLDQVNLAFSAFGNDLKNLGLTIALDNLDNLGSPLALLQQLAAVAGLTPRLLQELDILNINPDVVLDPPVLLAPLMLLEKILYKVFVGITGNDLNEILQLLGVTTPGIHNLADLLNPVKIFPQSFFSLTVRTVDGLRGIYLDQTGSVNNKLIDSVPIYVQEKYQLLSQAIPPDQALANQCIRVALQQIKNIFNLSLPVLAESYLKLVTTRDLPLINALTTPVPQSVLDFYTNNFATGSGPENTLVLGDLIGAAAGIGYTDRIINATEIINSLAADTNIVNLTATYQRMNILMNSLSDWGDPAGNTVVIPSGIAQGTYTATYQTVTITPEPPALPFEIEVLIETAGGNAFRTGLIPNAQSFVNSFVSADPTTANTLASNWVDMAQKLISENNQLQAASIVIEDLIPDQRGVVQGFAENLTSYGTDTKVNGTAQFLDQVANKVTIGGQAMIGALRQGRNTAVLDTAGIGNNIEIPDTFKEPPPQANIDLAEYSESAAANLIIR
jgi:hypothetical protein